MSATITVETRLPADQLEQLADLVAERVAPHLRRPQGLTIAQVCRMLGGDDPISPQTLTKLEREGYLRPWRYGRIVRHDERQVADLLASGDLNAILAEMQAA